MTFPADGARADASRSSDGALPWDSTGWPRTLPKERCLIASLFVASVAFRRSRRRVMGDRAVQRQVFRHDRPLLKHRPSGKPRIRMTSNISGTSTDRSTTRQIRAVCALPNIDGSAPSKVPDPDGHSSARSVARPYSPLTRLMLPLCNFTVHRSGDPKPTK